MDEALIVLLNQKNCSIDLQTLNLVREAVFRYHIRSESAYGKALWDAVDNSLNLILRCTLDTQ